MDASGERMIELRRDDLYDSAPTYVRSYARRNRMGFSTVLRQVPYTHSKRKKKNYRPPLPARSLDRAVARPPPLLSMILQLLYV